MVRRTRDRVVDTVPVDLDAPGGVKIRGVTQDIGPGGLFVRSKMLLPIGTEVEVQLRLCDPPLRLSAVVVHALAPEEARALGRTPGMGFAFGPLSAGTRFAIETHIAEVKDKQRLASAPLEEHMRVVVADGEPRLLERMSMALDRAGFDVVTCATGVEAYSACLKSPPSVVVADLHLPVVDGMRLLQTMGARPELAGVPVLMMSEDSGDLRRLRAYQLGAMDFLPKPFFVVELCIRVRRLAAQYMHQSRRVVLRGELNKIGFTTLLTLFGHDRKSGILAVTGGEDVAWITLAEGRVVKASALGSGAGSLETVMRVLSWQDGYFEFTACDVKIDDEIGMGTTQLLLEHARLQDERNRARPSTGSG